MSKTYWLDLAFAISSCPRNVENSYNTYNTYDKKGNNRQISKH